MTETSGSEEQMKTPKKSKLDPADNGKGFKKVPKGKEKGTTKWTPLWSRKDKGMKK